MKILVSKHVLLFILYSEYFFICPEGGSVTSTACDAETSLRTGIFPISDLHVLHCYLSEFPSIVQTLLILSIILF